MSETKKKTRARKLSSEQLGIVRGLWEAGIGTKAEIAEEVGATFDQVDYAIGKYGWVQGARAEYYEEKAREAIEAEMGERIKALMKDREAAVQRAVALTNMIEGRVIKTMKVNDEKKLPDEMMLGSMKTLECASRIIQNTFHVKRFALGMDKEDANETDDLAQIEIFEMTADDVEEIRQEQERALAQMDVTSVDV